MRSATEELLRRFRQKDRRALSELLTLVESGQAPLVPEPAVYPPIPTRVVGITGSGGAGKSTLVGELVAHLRREGLTVAVLACDPQSPVTGGALLGDRIRVRFEAGDEGVYFRSLSTRGAAGGISSAVKPAIEWLKAFGFEVVLVETVGVGQDQIGVRDAVDTLVLLVTPHTGDEVQWEKAGILEVADIVVVNKSDLSGAQRVRQQLTSALSLGQQSKNVPVLNTTAATGEGVKELWGEIAGTST